MVKKKAHKRKILKITTLTLKKEIAKASSVKRIVPRGEGVYPGSERIFAQNHFHKIPKTPSIHFSDVYIKEFRDAKSVKIPKLKVAILLHLYYHDLSTKFLEDFKILKKQMSFHLYVTIVQNSSADDLKLKEDYEKISAQVKLVPNAGKDILPKLRVLNELVEQKKKYDYVFLLHDKKSPSYERNDDSKWMDTWRQDLTSLLFDKALREHCLFTLYSYPQIGILGHLKHLHYGPGWHEGLYGRTRYLNECKLLNFHSQIKQYLKIPISKKGRPIKQDFTQRFSTEQTWFVGGTMFWMRWDVIEFCIKEYNMTSLLRALNNEKGDIKDPSLTHACERFFGHMAVMAGKKVLGYGQNI